jgi:hypothetical protein
MNVLGTDGNEVRGELDLAILEVHRITKVDDACVVRIGHRQREVDPSADALIGSRIAKHLAFKNACTGSNLDPKHPRLERENTKQ